MTTRSFSSYAVIPAAGRSVRMGRPKLLLPWKSATVIEAVAKAWQASGVDKVLVVVRADDAPLQEAIRRAALEPVIADLPPADMKTSVRFGVEAIAAGARPGPNDVLLVAPGDTPLVSSEVIDRLLAEHQPDAPMILVPRCRGRRGHPVLFPWHLLAEIAKIPGDRGLDWLLEQFPVRYVEVADEAISRDMDTPEEYERMRAEG